MLPTLDTLSFPCTLPSTNTSISVRPYLVREERMLLMAQESDDTDVITDAISQTIRNCTFNVVNPDIQPYFDIEYLLIQLRARSVGDTVKPIYTCQNIIEDNQRCGHSVTVTVDLNQVKVEPGEGHTNMVRLTSDLTLYLKYPTIKDVYRFATLSKNPATQLDSIVDLFDRVDDISKGQSYSFSSVPVDEKIDFLNQMSAMHVDAMMTFLDTMPKVRHETTFTCDKCKYTSPLKFEGLMDFFV